MEWMLYAKKEYSHTAKEKLSYFMELGAKLSGFNIKAEAAIGNSWGNTK